MIEFNFDVNTREYRRVNAYWLGRASLLAYQDPLTAKAELESLGLTEFVSFDTKETQAFIAGNANVLILAFRGTTALLDWIQDADVDLIGGPAGRIHEGFSVALSYVWRDVWDFIKNLRNGRPLWLTGHSLGAALATLATAKLRLERDEAVNGLYNFGQPRAGDREFARVFDLDFGAQTFRYVNDKDIVPRVPLRLMQYSHVGTFKFFDNDGDQQDDANWWDIVAKRIQETIPQLIPQHLPVFGGLLPDSLAAIDGLSTRNVEEIDDHRMDLYLANLEKALAGGA